MLRSSRNNIDKKVKGCLKMKFLIPTSHLSRYPRFGEARWAMQKNKEHTGITQSVHQREEPSRGAPLRKDCGTRVGCHPPEAFPKHFPLSYVVQTVQVLSPVVLRRNGVGTVLKPF